MSRDGHRQHGIIPHSRSSYRGEIEPQLGTTHKTSASRRDNPSTYRNQKSVDSHSTGVIRILQSLDTAEQHGDESDPRQYSTASVTPRVSHHHNVGSNPLVHGSVSPPMTVPSPRKRVAGDGPVSPSHRPDTPSKILRQAPQTTSSPASHGQKTKVDRSQRDLQQTNPTMTLNERSRRNQHMSPRFTSLEANIAGTLPTSTGVPLDNKASIKPRMAITPPIESVPRKQSNEPIGTPTTGNDGTNSTNAEDTPMSNAPGPEENRDDIASNPDEENAEEAEPPPAIPMKKQPDSKPISQTQLAVEVKGIYAGLVLVEAKCVNVVRAQTQSLTEAQNGSKPSSSVQYADHWQALTALHRTLLHEHHDFFLASQHPSAAPALRELASKYAMPARMWRHGIHGFLELLRLRLPSSLEYMIAFVYQAYQMMALLYETVPGFEETWIECLGDLARYRFAIEEEDAKTREIWTAVASYWYSMASDRSPKIGRLYHHLAILARTQALYQLSLYCRSLTAVIPFASARESILTLLEPSLARPMYNNLRQPSPDPWFIRFTALLYTNKAPALIDQASTTFLHHLDAYLFLNEDWKKKGTYVAVCLIGGLFRFGAPTSALREIFNGKDATESKANVPTKSGSTNIDSGQSKSLAETAKNETSEAWHLTYATFSLALGRPKDSKVLPHVAVILTFFYSLMSTEQGCQLIDDNFPWDLVANYLNALSQTFVIRSESLKSDNFPNLARILPEDYTIREQVWDQYFFPANFFKDMPADLDERMMEHHWTDEVRRERVLWLGTRLASVDEAKKQNRPWLAYSSKERAFSVSSHV